MDTIDDDTYALMAKRVYDMAGTVRDVKVSLNDEKLKVKNFKQVRPLDAARTVLSCIIDGHSMWRCISTLPLKQLPMLRAVLPSLSLLSSLKSSTNDGRWPLHYQTVRLNRCHLRTRYPPSKAVRTSTWSPHNWQTSCKRSVPLAIVSAADGD